jgi:sugar phosphate permease
MDPERAEAVELDPPLQERITVAPPEPQAEIISPLPWKKLIALMIIATAETINYNSIYPYINFMVKDLCNISDTRELGYYVGIVASSVYFASFLSSYFWGFISDKYGRRPGLLAGLIGGLTCTTLFGFSQTFMWAVAARFSSGLLNGNTGIAKSMLAEITDKTNQARAFSLFGLTWSVGGIVGPLIGGLLSNPADQYPSVFGNVEFLKKFPYLLPNLAVASLGVTGLIIGYCTLNETKPSIVSRKFVKLSKAEAQELELATVSTSTTMSEISEDDVRVMQSKSWRMPEVIRDRVVILACLCYAILGFLWVIFEEVFPLWSINDVQYGGIGFTQSDIGIIQSIGGVFTLLFQIFMYPVLAKRWSVLGTFRYGILIGLPGFLLMPEVVFLVGMPSWVLYAVMVFLIILLQASSEMTFVSVFILISNSAHPHNMGAVNGLGQSLVSMLRTFGPFTGSAVLSWSMTNGLYFPLDDHLMFIIVSLLLLVIFGLSFLLPTSINHPKQDDKAADELSGEEIC